MYSSIVILRNSCSVVKVYGYTFTSLVPFYKGGNFVGKVFALLEDGDFIPCSTVFQSYLDNGRVII